MPFNTKHGLYFYAYVLVIRDRNIIACAKFNSKNHAENFEFTSVPVKGFDTVKMFN